jgi:hypothetical protein
MAGSSLAHPYGVMFGQVVEKYLKDNPEQLHMPAASLTLLTVMASWPCPK